MALSNAERQARFRAKQKALIAASENVVPIQLTQFGDDRHLPVKNILRQARAEKLDDIMIIGRSDEGELWAASSPNAGQSLWLLEKLKESLLSGNPWEVV